MYMNIRRERSHRCGHSNIDFRTKNDTESIKTFMPWKSKKEFGTMGNDFYKLSFNENKKLLKVTENINNQKNILHEIPDPKYYKTAQFYQSNNIPIKSKGMTISERVAQLDESFKGKEKFTGESMMIADLTKNRKLKREMEERNRLRKIQNLIAEAELSEKDKKDRNRLNEKIEKIISDKTEKNKSSYHETQLQKIDAKETGENRVDINKIKEIRLALRRRYAPRTNIRKIFKEWDKSNTGEISIIDAYNMINKLSIPINFDETRALISSSNNRNNEALNMEEFMHLVFNDNDELNLKIKNISKIEDRFQTEGEKLEFFKKSMANKISESAQKDCLKYLIEYLRLVIPKLAKKFNHNSEDKLHCDLKTFKNVIGNFQIPQKYIEDNILTNVYEKFKDKDRDKMNYRNFIDFVIDGQEINDFFDYKKKLINNLEQKLNGLTERIQEKSDALKSASENKIKFAESLRKEIEEKKSFKNNHNYLDDKITNQTTLVSKFEKDINSAQPSLGFIQKLFKDKELYFEKKNQIESSLSANPQVFSLEKPKTRFNANPPHKDTFYLISPPVEASSYIDEKKRFDIRCKWDVDFQLEEKLKKQSVENKIIERKRYINDMLSQRIEAKENYQEQKDNLGQLVRTHKVYNYENKNKKRSEMIE